MTDRNTAPAIIDAVNMQLALKPYTHFVLDNQVPVYSIDAGAQEVMMIEWVFYAGNWYEEKNIVAATTNFMLKNGTRLKNAFSINEYFEFYGAYLNRSCYNETATITLHCLSKHLNELLPVVSELLTDCIFPENELAIYKQNQQQRLTVNLKKCDFIANRLIDEYIYGFHHPYGRYTSTLDFEQLQREELVSFYDRFYTKGRCLIFVSGKLPADWDQQLNKSFGQLALNQHPLPEIVFNPQPAEKKMYAITNDAEGVQGAIRIARPMFNRHHPDFSGMQVLNNIFGGYFGSRLMSNIREDKGYTYGIHSHIQNHLHTSALVIATEAGREVSEATVTEIYKEMAVLREELVSEEELSLVRNYMMGSLLGDLDGPFQIMARWKNYLLNGLTGEYFTQSIQTVRSISAAELRELANKYLDPEDYYELVVV